MKKIILLLAIAALFSCTKNKKFLGDEDVEVTISADKGYITVDYIDTDGSTVVVDSVRAFMVIMEKPKHHDLYFRATSVTPNGRIVGRLAKDRVRLDFKEVYGEMMVVELKE